MFRLLMGDIFPVNTNKKKDTHWRIRRYSEVHTYPVSTSTAPPWWATAVDPEWSSCLAAHSLFSTRQPEWLSQKLKHNLSPAKSPHITAQGTHNKAPTPDHSLKAMPASLVISSHLPHVHSEPAGLDPALLPPARRCQAHSSLKAFSQLFPPPAMLFPETGSFLIPV